MFFYFNPKKLTKPQLPLDWEIKIVHLNIGLIRSLDIFSVIISAIFKVEGKV